MICNTPFKLLWLFINENFENNIIVSNETRICGKIDDACAMAARRIMKSKLFEENDSGSAFNFTQTLVLILILVSY